MSAPITLDIKATGQAEAKKSVLDVIAQGHQMSKFGKGGLYSSPKELKDAEKVLKNIEKIQALLQSDAKKTNNINKEGNALLAERQVLLTKLYKSASAAKTNINSRIDASKAAQIGIVPVGGKKDNKEKSETEERSALGQFAAGYGEAKIAKLILGQLYGSVKQAYNSQLTLQQSLPMFRGSDAQKASILSGLTNQNGDFGAAFQNSYNGLKGISSKSMVEAATKLGAMGGNIGDIGQSGDLAGAFLLAQKSGVSEQSLLSSRQTALNSGRMNQGGQDVRDLLSDAVRSGLEGARKGEFIDGVNRIANNLQNSGMNIDIKDVSRMLSNLGQNQANPMLQGQFGANFAESIHNVAQNPTSTAQKMLAMNVLAKYYKGKSLQQVAIETTQGQGATDWDMRMGGMAGEIFGKLTPFAAGSSPLNQSPLFPGTVASQWNGAGNPFDPKSRKFIAPRDQTPGFNNNSDWNDYLRGLGGGAGAGTAFGENLGAGVSSTKQTIGQTMMSILNPIAQNIQPVSTNLQNVSTSLDGVGHKLDDLNKNLTTYNNGVTVR